MSTPLYRHHPTMFADEPGRFVLACILCLVGVGFIWLGVWYIINRNTLLTVDEERVVLRRGVFNRESVEVDINSIRAVRVDQTLADRIFNCGLLKVYTAGDSPDLEQDGLPDPEKLRTVLRRVREGAA